MSGTPVDPIDFYDCLRYALDRDVAGPPLKYTDWRYLYAGQVAQAPSVLQTMIDCQVFASYPGRLGAISPEALAQLETKFRVASQPVPHQMPTPAAGWKSLAEAAGRALDVALQENRQLQARIAELEKQAPPTKPEMTPSDYAAQAFRMDHIPDSYGR